MKEVAVRTRTGTVKSMMNWWVLPPVWSFEADHEHGAHSRLSRVHGSARFDVRRHGSGVAERSSYDGAVSPSGGSTLLWHHIAGVVVGMQSIAWSTRHCSFCFVWVAHTVVLGSSQVTLPQTSVIRVQNSRVRV